MKAIKTTWFFPYVVKNNKLKPNLRILNAKFNTGVYVIKETKTNKVVYVGYSASNLHKTMYRHFQKWNDKSQQRTVLKKNGYKVRIIFATPSKAARLEKYLIGLYKPKYNTMQYTAELKDDKNDFSDVQKYYGSKSIVLNSGEDYPF